MGCSPASGCSQLLLTVLGCPWLLLAASARAWLLFTAPDCSWLPLTAPGCYRLLLAAPGCSWLLLAAPGCFWPLLAAPGYSWLFPWLLPYMRLRSHGDEKHEFQGYRGYDTDCCSVYRNTVPLKTRFLKIKFSHKFEHACINHSRTRVSLMHASKRAGPHRHTLSVIPPHPQSHY